MERVSAAELLLNFRDGVFTCEDYVERLIHRQELLQNNKYFTVFDPEPLRKAAKVADARYKSDNPRPLEGLPIAFKDNIDILGQHNSAGTKAFWGRHPKRTATVVKKLLEAGAINAGRTNMHELAYGGTTLNEFFGPARNFWNIDHNTGGSSGGSGAAVAADIVPAALGTDTAGSVRIPANASGVVGYRPTVNAWPSDYGIKMTHLRDSIGPMARSVADIALLDTVVTGSTHNSDLEPVDIRIGVPRQHFWNHVEPEVLARCEAFLDRLKSAGFILVESEGPSPHLIDTAHATTLPQVNFELFRRLQDYIDANEYADLTVEAVVEQISGKDIKDIFEDALKNPVTQEDYNEALVKREALIQEFERYVNQNNIACWIFPTIKIPPPLISTSAKWITFEGKQWDLNDLTLQNVDVASNGDHCGITMPCGRILKSGVPFGIEIDGLPGTDAMLIDIALAIEKAGVILM